MVCKTVDTVVREEMRPSLSDLKTQVEQERYAVEKEHKSQSVDSLTLNWCEVVREELSKYHYPDSIQMTTESSYTRACDLLSHAIPQLAKRVDQGRIPPSVDKCYKAKIRQSSLYDMIADLSEQVLYILWVCAELNM